MEGESINDWEQVQLELPNDHLSIFPPTFHEGLQITSPNSLTPNRANSSDGSNSEGEEEALSPDPNPKVGYGIRKRLRLRFEILRPGIAWVLSRARGGGGFWSFATVSVVAAAAASVMMLYWRVKRWRRWVRKKSQNRLIVLIKEKEQKISQLLLQIAQMNEIFSARRKVSVIRVG